LPNFFSKCSSDHSCFLLFECVPIISETMTWRCALSLDWFLWYVQEGLQKTGCSMVGERPLNTFDFFRNFTIFSCKFLWRAAQSLKTEADNSSSNFTWSMTKCISIERYQILNVTVLNASLSTTISPKTATDSNCPKVEHSPSKTHHPWHHSVDTKNDFMHVKFEIRFVISFKRKSISNKKWHFSWGTAHAFFAKAGVENFGSLLLFWTWRMSWTHGACVDIVWKAK
jgi:hypothetical protein